MLVSKRGHALIEVKFDPQHSFALHGCALAEGLMGWISPVVVLTLLLVSIQPSGAQEPSGRVDLEELALLPSELFPARVVFTKSSAVCPEDYGFLQISAGWLRHHRVDVLRRTQSSWESFRAIDDNTYRYRVS